MPLKRANRPVPYIVVQMPVGSSESDPCSVIWAGVPGGRLSTHAQLAWQESRTDHGIATSSTIVKRIMRLQHDTNYSCNWQCRVHFKFDYLLVTCPTMQNLLSPRWWQMSNRRDLVILNGYRTITLRCAVVWNTQPDMWHHSLMPILRLLLKYSTELTIGLMMPLKMYLKC